MKQPIAKRRAAAPDLPEFARLLPEIQTLIEASRQHVVSTANLTLVRLEKESGPGETVRYEEPSHVKAEGRGLKAEVWNRNRKTT